MGTKTAVQERDAVDVVTNTMFSLSFLDEISKLIFSQHRGQVSVGHFYDEWLKSTGAPEDKIPFNIGVFTAYLYVGLLVTKENWSSLVPDKPISSLDADWGLVGVSTGGVQAPDPHLPYLIRRLRNALGHTNFEFDVPADLKSPSDIHDRVSIRFWDENPRDPNDKVDVQLTLMQLEKLIKRFHAEVHLAVRTKHGIKGPQK